MEVDAAAAAPAADQAGEQATSLGFLQLHDAFKRMVAVGVDVVDEQVRVSLGATRRSTTRACRAPTRVV